MKHKDHIAEADRIGRDSWPLQCFRALPQNASPKRLVDALKRDQTWQDIHHSFVHGEIDRLIRSIEREAMTQKRKGKT